MTQGGGKGWGGYYATHPSSSAHGIPTYPLVAANASSSSNNNNNNNNNSGDDTAGMICGVLVCLLFLVLLGFTLSYPGTYYYRKYYYYYGDGTPSSASMPLPPLHPYPYMP